MLDQGLRPLPDLVGALGTKPLFRRRRVPDRVHPLAAPAANRPPLLDRAVTALGDRRSHDRLDLFDGDDVEAHSFPLLTREPERRTFFDLRASATSASTAFCRMYRQGRAKCRRVPFHFTRQLCGVAAKHT